MGNRVISQIKIGDEIFDIRDKIGPDGALHLLGINQFQEGPEQPGQHKITDGGTQTPYINGAYVPLTSLKTGDVVLQNKSTAAASTDLKEEYLWIQTGTTAGTGQWELLGDEGSYVVKGTTITTGATTSTGSVLGEHTFTGTTATINISGNISGGNLPVSETSDTSVTALSWSGDHAHTVSIGATTTDSGHTFKGTADTKTISFTPKVTISLGAATSDSGHTFEGTAGTVTVTGEGVAGVDDHSYQPAGVITTSAEVETGLHVFRGTKATLTHSLTKETVTSTGTYTPAGTITAPTLNLTPTTTVALTTIGTTTSGGVILGTVAANSEILEIFNVLASTANFVSTITGSVSAPTFNGTAKTITVTTTDAVTAVSNHEYTPNGNVDKGHVFTGTTATLSHSVTTDTLTLTGTFTPAGSVKKPHTVSGQTTTVTITITPSGSISGDHTINTTTISFSKRLVAALSTLTLNASGTYQPEGTVTASGSGASGHSVSMNSHTHTATLE